MTVLTLPTVNIVGSVGPNVPSPWGAPTQEDPSSANNPAAWDTITVGGATWFGKFDIRGAERSYKLDAKHALGVNGVTTTMQGNKPKDFHLIFYLWAHSQWAPFLAFLQAFFYDTTKTTIVPNEISTPLLDVLGISAILTRSVGISKPDHEGVVAVDITVQEYCPPVLVSATQTPSGPATSPTNTPGTTPDPVQDYIQAQIGAQYALNWSQQNGVAGPPALP